MTEPLNIDQLLQSGALEGPFNRTRPLTLTWRMRVVRLVRAFKLWRIK